MSTKIEEKMECPLCGTPLIQQGSSRYGTLCEHGFGNEPSLKPEYHCTNKDCMIHSYMFWDYYGDVYITDYKTHSYNKKHHYPNLNYTANNSGARQASIEVSKFGLKKETWLPSWLMLGFLTPRIDYMYKADMRGNVLKRGFRMSYWKKDPRTTIYIGWNFPWSTWIYLWSKFRKDIKSKNYKRAFEEAGNRDLRYRMFEKFVQTLFYKKFKLSKMQ